MRIHKNVIAVLFTAFAAFISAAPAVHAWQVQVTNTLAHPSYVYVLWTDNGRWEHRGINRSDTTTFESTGTCPIAINGALVTLATPIPSEPICINGQPTDRTGYGCSPTCGDTSWDITWCEGDPLTRMVCFKPQRK